MLSTSRVVALRGWNKSIKPRSSTLTLTKMSSDVTPNGAHQHEHLLERFKTTVPPLDGSSHKGQHGKLAVVGGCTAYTGAPYYAAMSAHKVGADLTYVFCTPGAAPVIKGFSPDMIVLPLLLDDKAPSDEKTLSDRQNEVQPWLSRMTVLVVGPGLGEDPGPQAAAAQMIRLGKEAGLPMLIDGSGISTVAADPSLIQGYRRCILTPNIAELGRLASAVNVILEGSASEKWQSDAQKIAKAWDGPILVSKGRHDIITDGHSSMVCDQPGSLKRCGGIGDLLAGTLGTFLGWQYGLQKTSGREPTEEQLMVASYAACSMVRAASLTAFHEHGRALSAGDIVPVLPGTFKKSFGP